MKKRVLALTLALLLLLAGCAGTGDTNDTAGDTGDTGDTAGSSDTSSVPEGMDKTGRYLLSPSGEAVINDEACMNTVATEDNYRVFYEIFVGSFSDSDGDGIGDLKGIINRMDYLNDGDDDSGLSLGVEGIWLSPIFKSPTYHKYDVDDYYQIDPVFGTEDDLKLLLELAHERNVKVILDMVINHTGPNNAWFNAFRAHLLQDPRQRRSL